MVTEQELRRLPLESHLAWVPRPEPHRPDGLSRLPDTKENSIIAFEVEINEKAAPKYKPVGRYYREAPEIHRVIWLVEKPSTSMRIHSRLNDAKYEIDKHNFVIFEEFFNHGWQSLIAVGPDRGQSMAKLLRYCRYTGGVLIPRQYHLNVSKSPHKLKTSQSYQRGDFSD